MKRLVIAMIACMALAGVATAQLKPEKTEVFRSVEQMPTFPGGDAALMKHLSENIEYPVEAAAANIQGRVVLQFVVTPDGTVGDVKVVRSVDPSLDAEAVRVVKTLPPFNPGRQGGHPVPVWYTLPIQFKLPTDTPSQEVAYGQRDADASPSTNTNTNTHPDVYRSVEQMPTFPGGDAALMKHIAENIEYPADAAAANIQGRVILQFVVTPDGTVGDVKVVRSISPSLDTEAIRVIKTLPPFNPGRQSGHPVPVWYTLPVQFKLPTLDQSGE